MLLLSFPLFSFCNPFPLLALTEVSSLVRRPSFSVVYVNLILFHFIPCFFLKKKIFISNDLYVHRPTFFSTKKNDVNQTIEGIHWRREIRTTEGGLLKCSLNAGAKNLLEEFRPDLSQV